MKKRIIEESGKCLSNKKMTVLSFDSSSELYRLCRKSDKPRIKEYYNERSYFYLGEYGRKSVELIKDGKSEFNYSGKKTKTNTVEADGVKRRKQFSEYDGLVDPTRVMGGSTQPFIKKPKRRRKQRTVVIYICINASAADEPEDICRFVLHCVNKAYGYIKKGYMVEINSIFVATQSTTTHNHVTSVVRMKKYKERMDFKRLSSMSYPAFFRIYNFASICMQDEDMKSSLGTPCSKKQGKHVIENIIGKTNSHLLTNSHLFMFNEWKNNIKKY